MLDENKWNEENSESLKARQQIENEGAEGREGERALTVENDRTGSREAETGGEQTVQRTQAAQSDGSQIAQVQDGNVQNSRSDSSQNLQGGSQNPQGYAGQYQNYGGNPQNPYQGQNPYQQPYYQNYYQNYNYGQNPQGAGQNPYGSQNMNRGQAPNQGPNRNPVLPPRSGQTQSHQSQSHQAKKYSMARTIAGVTAAALLFGVVSGGTMFGVNRAAGLLFPTAAARTETEAVQETLGETETVPAVSQNAGSSGVTGVVLEDVSPIVEAAMPSVVAITNTMLYNRSWFGQTQTYEIPSSGSGIIVDQNDTELLIVTNNHVIADANTLAVTFVDGKSVDAAVKGTDSESDLAIIAVPLEEIEADTKSAIKAASMGDSDALKMGEGVIAIGNALGHGQSVTVGHVSALNREITVDGITKTVIQTDAAINPGNSGGALLNSAGELIGINEAKYADTDVEGVGYAIPISLAKDIIDDLKNRTTKLEVNEAKRGHLGIQVQNIDAVTAKLYGMPEGVYVYKITEGSAAEASDLREKDIITKFDGERVRTFADLEHLQTYYEAGTTVTLTVESLEDGQYVEREVTITLGERPAENEANSANRGK